jgi:hypothetical protein
MLRNGHVRFGGRAAETTSRKTGMALLPDPCTHVATWVGVRLCGVLHRRLLSADHRVALLGEHEYQPALGRAGDGNLAAAADRTLDPGVGPPLHRRVAVHLDPLHERLAKAGAKPSIGSVGDSYDNAMAESIIGLFKTEVIRCQGPWRNRDAVEMATLEWVDWYNNRRLFEALGDIPPAEAESAYYATMTPSESPRMAEQTLQ